MRRWSMTACAHHVTVATERPATTHGGRVLENICSTCGVVVSAELVGHVPEFATVNKSAIGHAFERIEALEKRLSLIECHVVGCALCYLERGERGE